MRRAVAGLLFSVLGAALSAGPTLAAVDVAVAVSPSQGTIGQPVEVLLRTFVPEPIGDTSLPIPSLAYPVASGLWNVLYPVADYPFDVLARADDGTSIAVSLTRDPSDATLWRGTFTPTASGSWTVSVRNFPAGTLGASARLVVTSGDAVPAVWLVGAATLLIGMLVGLFLGRRGIGRWRRVTRRQPRGRG
ncbi:MAG TPA: hypothetical protein VID26_02445 [Candidatus Limnocylindrales bacterium]